MSAINGRMPINSPIRELQEKDAVKYFKDYMDFCEKDGMGIPSKEPYNLAIAAIEKQVPKKPVEDRCTEHTHYKCKCGYIFRTEYADGLRAGCIYRYCPDCGQAIDWSEEE